VGQEAIVTQVDKKEQLHHAANAKESLDHQRPTSADQMADGGGDAFLVQ
jgi:hypothetical protein